MATHTWDMLLEHGCCRFALCIPAGPQLLHPHPPGTADRQPAVMLRPGHGEDLAVPAGDTLRAGDEDPGMCHSP